MRLLKATRVLVDQIADSKMLFQGEQICFSTGEMNDEYYFDVWCYGFYINNESFTVRKQNLSSRVQSEQEKRGKAIYDILANAGNKNQTNFRKTSN